MTIIKIIIKIPGTPAVMATILQFNNNNNNNNAYDYFSIFFIVRSIIEHSRCKQGWTKHEATNR
jgi:hypothetical protein